MPAVPNPAAFNARIEALTQALDASPDREARTCARELLRLVLELHAAGFRRILESIDGAPGLRDRLAADPVIGSLLALHGLAPEVETESSPLRLVQIGRRPAPEVGFPTLVHEGGAMRCDRCGAALPATHGHCIDLATRRLSCACRACWLLAGAQGESGPVRAVPDRYAARSALRLNDAQWDALQVPVTVAFFMFNSVVGRTIAFYPSPAGATESALPLEAWRDIERANPWLTEVAPDVEALLVRRGPAGDGSECCIVPIDACYELVGRIRLHWRGAGGGDAARREIDRFFAEAAAKSSGAAGAR